ncbi:MAG: radical SAM family heme chaperone HemW [Candidatus Limnocylindrales bacterium]
MQVPVPPVAPVPVPPVALYVHVPFCVSLCPYCDFVVYAGSAARGPATRVDAYLGAVRAEIGLRADVVDAAFGAPGTAGRAPLETVYLGGGTPTLLPADALTGLLDLVRARFGVADDAEVTIESNPGPDERGDAGVLVAAGFNRLSLGAQAMDGASLRRLGRRHRPADVAAAVEDARAAGFRSVSLDLLYDTPGQSVEAWASTLDDALALAPDHVSAYALTLDDPDEEGLTGPLGDHLPTRPGARRWRETANHEQSDDRAAEHYELAVERLGAAGYRGYEISNWGLPGHESRHNLVYWQRRPYEAVGPGAHAFDGVTRRWNAARLDRYLAALAPAAGGLAVTPPGGSEAISSADAAAEVVILGLRLDAGLPLDEAEAGPLGPHLAWALEAGLLVRFGRQGERVHLTTRGRLVSNDLFARLV